MSPAPERALAVGKAAEYLVCADLILAGYSAFLTDQGCPYDIVADVSGRLLRIQVKSTAQPRPIPGAAQRGPSYIFHCRRSGHRGLKTVGNHEFDLLALVALDIRKVAYLTIGPHVLRSIHLRTADNPSKHGNKSRGCILDYPFEAALCDLLGVE